ncbi:unnamed protein product [Oncorhynchus mykiss]|uniref:Tc1-like transposase DDE domain-containing protein n=1 Tax=Oncorhynchus mykiss TaxID=8022 RepID=A0A060YE22_ONCMY|nr:unnamed protein product [Oncorhynchus mykiss]
MCGSHCEKWRWRCDGVGCFASDTICALFRIEGTLNQHGYHSILQQYAIPFGLLLGLSFVFQQDNDQHTSMLCKGYLIKKESDGMLHQMNCPPQSPDLNPIEMVWDKLDRRVKEKQRTSAQHIWELLQDCKTFLVKLVERMPRVCKAVIKFVQTFDLYCIFLNYIILL